MIRLATLILGALLAFNASADQDFCSTAGRFGESIYLMKDSSDTERQAYINYSLSLNPGFLSLSAIDREIFFRYLTSINRFVGNTKEDIKNPYSFFYKKCAAESLVAIKKIEKNLKKCSIIGEFTSYIYEEKTKGRGLRELTLEINEIQQKGEDKSTKQDSLVDIMKNSANAVYKNKSLSRNEIVQEQYSKCLSMD
jgi:hypothetical protein